MDTVSNWADVYPFIPAGRTGKGGLVSTEPLHCSAVGLQQMFNKQFSSFRQPVSVGRPAAVQTKGKGGKQRKFRGRNS